MKFCRILIVNFVFVHLLQFNLIDQRNKYCDDKYFGELQNNHVYFEERREFTQNYFLDKYNDIIQYWKDRDSQALFQAFMPFGILSIVYILVLFFVLLFFVFFCIKKGQKFAEKSSRNKCCIYVTLAFIIVLFILAFILIVVSTSYQKGIYCSIFEISGSILYGSQEESAFIGVLTYQNLIQRFYQDIQSTSSNVSDFQYIINQNFIAKSNEAISSLHDFYKNNLLIKTNNGEGQLQTPISILSQSELLNNTAESEFNKLANISYTLTRAAYAGLNYDSSESEVYAQNIAGKLQTFGSQQEEIAKQLASDIKSMFDLSTATAYLSLIFIIVILIVSFIITCKGFKQKEKYRRNMLCLIIYQILLILLVILIFLMFIGLTSIWGSCGLVRELNSGNLKFFKENNFEINTMLNDMFRSCYDEYDSSTIVEVITKSDSFQQQQFFQNINNILIGFNNYIQFADETNTNYSKGISHQVTRYDNHESGLILDHYDAQSQLYILNSGISCDDKYFRFNNNNCDSSGDCMIITGSTQFQIPACSENQTLLQSILTNLDAYRNAQRSNAEDLKNRLQNKQNSPQNLQLQLYNDLQSAKSIVQSQYDKFLSTKQFLNENEINLPLYQLMSCKSIKLPSLKYEKKACFRYNLYMYIAMIILFFISLMLFLISFCLCTEIRKTVNKMTQIHEKTEIKKNNGNLSFEIATDISNIIEDNEKVPMF